MGMHGKGKKKLKAYVKFFAVLGMMCLLIMVFLRPFLLTKDYVDEYLDFSYSMNHMGGLTWRMDICTLNPLVFRTQRQLDRFIRRHRQISWHGDVRTVRYADSLRLPAEFFEENFLILVPVEDSSSVRHRVDSIDRYGNIAITALTPQYIRTDLNQRFVKIKICNAHIPRRFSVDVNRESIG